MDGLLQLQVARSVPLILGSRPTIWARQRSLPLSRTHCSCSIAGDPITVTPAGMSLEILAHAADSCAVVKHHVVLHADPSAQEPRRFPAAPPVIRTEPQSCTAGQSGHYGRPERGYQSSCPVRCGVAPNSARLIVELVPISTSSSISTVPICGILLWRPPKNW